jgi:hypothetical protein
MSIWKLVEGSWPPVLFPGADIAKSAKYQMKAAKKEIVCFQA